MNRLDNVAPRICRHDSFVVLVKSTGFDNLGVVTTWSGGGTRGGGGPV